VIDGCCHGGLGSGRENFAIRVVGFGFVLGLWFEKTRTRGFVLYPEPQTIVVILRFCSLTAPEFVSESWQLLLQFHLTTLHYQTVHSKDRQIYCFHVE
jgi:hypothetical protein